MKVSVHVKSLQLALEAEHERHKKEVAKITAEIELMGWLSAHPSPAVVTKRLGFDHREPKQLPKSLNDEQAAILTALNPLLLQGEYFPSAENFWKRYADSNIP